MLTAMPQMQESYVSPSGHFTLYFDMDGIHAVSTEDISGNGVPDYIDSAAVILDHIWQVEVDGLGFKPPPGMDGKPVVSYPVYFKNLGSSFYGQTIVNLSDIPSLAGLNYTSYIELRNNYDDPTLYTQGLDGLRVTAAHEFNHAIQLGYRVWTDEYGGFKDLYFLEMTSTWMEDVVYDYINDYYLYLPALYNGLDSEAFTSDSGLFPYGNALYLHMIEQKFGTQIVKQIWDRILAEDSFKAIKTVLQGYNTDWARSQNDYAVWLYFTGRRAIPGIYFSEAGEYPEIGFSDSEIYTVTSGAGFNESVRALAMKHLLLEDVGDIRYAALTESESNEPLYTHAESSGIVNNPVSFNRGQSVNLSVSGDLALVVSNPVEIDTEFEYALFADTTLVQAGPNPVLVQTADDGINFYNLPSNSNINIYNLNGRHLKTLNSGNEQTNRFVWDLRDLNNTRLA
ncbi:MAG: MXAN_6640 family putative metalloprotease, partial [Calditrichaceae bacterium]